MAAKNAKGAKKESEVVATGFKPALRAWRTEKFAQAAQTITDNL
jgi:hypothetical protein